MTDAGLHGGLGEPAWEQTLEIYAEYAFFCLLDTGVHDDCGFALPDDRSHGAGGAIAFPGPSWVTFLSGWSDHMASVTVQEWMVEPPPLPAGWESTVVDFAATGRVSLIHPLGGGDFVHRLRPGLYRLHVAVRGRDEVMAAVPAATEETVRGVEQWILRFVAAP